MGPNGHGTVRVTHTVVQVNMEGMVARNRHKLCKGGHLETTDIISET